MRGGHMDTYEPPPSTVYQPKDRRAGKRVVFGKVVETPEETAKRVETMKQIMRDTQLRIHRQQSKPHILERSKAKEPRLALMHGNGTSVRPSPWFSA